MNGNFMDCPLGQWSVRQPPGGDQDRRSGRSSGTMSTASAPPTILPTAP